MKYLFFVSREIWSSFNSIYAFLKIRHEYPTEFVAIYTDESKMRIVERMLLSLYTNVGRDLKMRKIKIGDGSVDEYRRVIEDVVDEGDIVDITGARKIMILSLTGIKGIRITYLYLADMRFSSLPFMMRPLTIQNLEVVET